jgi:agmatine deiminase
MATSRPKRIPATSPAQFNYVPYPLWRRRLPFPARLAAQFALRRLYPLAEDRHPPESDARLARYLSRFRLLAESDPAPIQRELALIDPLVADASALPEAPREAQAPVRLPAQWEPAEAVILAWPVLYPPLWPVFAAMTEAIIPVAEVIITVPVPAWARAAQLYLTRRGGISDYRRLRFLHLPTDDIWVRDYGPLIGYAPDGSRAVVSARYAANPAYPQTRDDAMPLRFAHCAGLPVRSLPLHLEGGNLWSDGAGTLIVSDRLIAANPYHTRAEIEHRLREIFEFEKLILTPRLALEETGHVDLLVKLGDPSTVLVSARGDSVLNRERRRATGALFRRETNAAGSPYKVIELPTPPPYVNWLVYPIHRTYTNALTVNGRVLVPTYGLKTDDTALKIYTEAMPGYEIIPIDCAAAINGGGAIHCLTREVPVGSEVISL